nr:hypothetical protein [Tanacetum cinerariifolium]
MRLQALVDKKKVITTEATIRDALRLDNAEGIDCLPNEEIFIELSKMGMGANRTSLNKFSSSMALAVICLYTGVAEVNINDVPATGVTDEGAADDNADVVLTAIEEPSIPSPTLPTQPPPPLQDIPSTSQKLERRNKLKVSKLRRLKKVGTSKRVDTSDDTVMDDVSKQGRIIKSMDADVDVTLQDVADIAKDVAVDAEIEKSVDVQGSMQDDEVEPVELQEVVEVVTTAKLMTEVVTAASATITVAAPTLTTALSAARRRKRVVIRDPKEIATPSTIIHTELKSKDKGKGIMVHKPKPLKKKTHIEQDKAYTRELKAKLNKNIDWDEVIEQVQRKEKEDNVVMRYQALKRKPQTEAQSRKNMMIYLRNVAGFKMDYFKGMTYDDIHPIFKKKFNFNKLDEKVEELRKHLQIVPNDDDDDVYTEATPLSLKVLVVDYEIYIENNKPYYKIKRADGTHQLYLSFLSMLRKFDREDLKVLWKLVKESSNLEESKKCSWFGKGQELETVRVMWCADYNIYYNTVDLVGREKISTYKVHSGSNAQ